MNGKALGIIETIGLVPAVEAGDVAVKTAEVTLMGLQAVGGGYVSLLVKGDVSAVKASIDAGSASAARLGTVASVTVIARTAEGLGKILIHEDKCPECNPGAKAESEPEVAPEVVTEAAVVEDPAPVDVPSCPAPVAPESIAVHLDSGDGEPQSFEMSDLKKLKVTKLRRLARQLPAFSIPRGEIKYAKKKDLLEAFTSYIKTLEM